MKFAKEIEDDAVPEWRDKYVDYKAGKKLIKQVSRSIRDTGSSPGPLLSPSPSSTPLLLPLPEPALDLPPRKRAVRNVNNIGNKLRKYVNNSAPNSTAPAAIKGTPQSRADVEDKKNAFVAFLDRQSDMVEDFYREKEEESTERLGDIREQLHLLRAQRTRERTKPPGRAREAMRPIGKPLRSAVKRVRFGSEGAKNQNTSFTPPSANVAQRVRQSDYVKKNDSPEISYAHAKRHLKRAMVVFYQSLEMLKSYAIVNHKAFRKINKKYDKATRERHPMRYFSEKITKAHFVQSEVVDSHIKTVEDLYARYFEGDSRKLAIGKLRRKHHERGEYTTSVFRNGLMFAAGLVLGVEALYKAGELLFDYDDAEKSSDTSYLLQLYGGYFLMLLLMMLFAGCCSIFEKMRVNYVFVFELDVRHNVNWRQMFELPCFFFFLLGITMLLNFMEVGGQDMYVFWPVVLVGLTLLTMFLPVKYFYWRPRLWFANSLRRLAMAPIPRVEFRDFFLGDMFCSQAYAMGNVALFFCLYARHWDNAPLCNSSHSRLLGFFSALPGVWRLLQCLRRYHDTRNVFPHLVNAGKYTFTFMQYASLSIFRISRTNNTFAAFIAISTINSVYCFIWDVLMDWSLGDSSARHKFLRPQLAYERVYWVYYLAIVQDFALRFNWIFYAIFRNEVQHSAILSFFVGLAEVCRRGVWVLFRVENEHCANIVHNRAIKDMSLPYEPRMPKPLQRRQSDSQANMTDEEQSLHSSLAAIRGQKTASPSGRSAPDRPKTLARTPSIGKRMGHALARAHTQDFERRRDSVNIDYDEDEDDDDDDDDDNGDDDDETDLSDDHYWRPDSAQEHHNLTRLQEDLQPFSLDSPRHESAEHSGTDDPGEGSSGDDSLSRRHHEGSSSAATTEVSAVRVQVRAGKPPKSS